MKIAKERDNRQNEMCVCLGLGLAHKAKNEIQTAISYYEKAFKIARGREDKEQQIIACSVIKAYLALGRESSHVGDLEPSKKYFFKAQTVSEQVNDKSLQKEGHANLGFVYYKSSMFEAAVKSYLTVQNIARHLGDRKEVANASLTLGDIFQELKKYDNAIESYQDTISISKDLKDEEMLLLASQKLGRLYLTLASVYSKDFDYDKAVELYRKTLEISEADPNDCLLHEKARTGLGTALLNLGHNEEAIELINAAQEASKKETNTGNHSLLSHTCAWLAFIRAITEGHKKICPVISFFAVISFLARCLAYFLQ